MAIQQDRDAEEDAPVHEPMSLYHRHRFPAAIISHCVCLYYHLPLSFREIEEVRAMRGVMLS